MFVCMYLLLEELMQGRAQRSLREDGAIILPKRCTFSKSCSPRAAAAAARVRGHGGDSAVHHMKGDATKDHSGPSPPKLQSNPS